MTITLKWLRHISKSRFSFGGHGVFFFCFPILYISLVCQGPTTSTASGPVPSMQKSQNFSPGEHKKSKILALGNSVWVNGKVYALLRHFLLGTAQSGSKKKSFDLHRVVRHISKSRLLRSILAV